MEQQILQLENEIADAEDETELPRVKTRFCEQLDSETSSIDDPLTELEVEKGRQHLDQRKDMPEPQPRVFAPKPIPPERISSLTKDPNVRPLAQPKREYGGSSEKVTNTDSILQSVVTNMNLIATGATLPLLEVVKFSGDPSEFFKFKALVTKDRSNPVEDARSSVSGGSRKSSRSSCSSSSRLCENAAIESVMAELRLAQLRRANERRLEQQILQLENEITDAEDEAELAQVKARFYEQLDSETLSIDDPLTELEVEKGRQHLDQRKAMPEPQPRVFAPKTIPPEKISSSTKDPNVRPLAQPKREYGGSSEKVFYVDDLLKAVVTTMVLEAKKIMQRLWKLQLDWDDPVPEYELAHWERWKSELSALSQVQIPRCYLQLQGEVKEISLHQYSDESDEADDASRGLKPKRLSSQHRWWKGPEYLWQSENNWPKTEIGEVPHDDPEVRNEAQIHSIRTVNPHVRVHSDARCVSKLTVYEMISHYSSWFKLQRYVAWLVRFCYWLRSWEVSPTTRTLTTEEQGRQGSEDVVQTCKVETSTDGRNSSCRRSLKGGSSAVV
ncbi:hypothetical protein ACROYT_G029955 [Oculina patagonica]